MMWLREYVYAHSEHLEDVLEGMPHLGLVIMHHLCSDPARCVCAAVFAVDTSVGVNTHILLFLWATLALFPRNV